MLTDKQIDQAKGPARGKKFRKLYDELGLYLLIGADGTRGWRFRYRRPDNGKETSLSLGSYQKVSLRLARQKRDEALEQLRDGINPASGRKQSGDGLTDPTFGDCAQQWLASVGASMAPKTLAKQKWLLGLLRGLNSKPIRTLKAGGQGGVIEALQGIERLNDRRETAHRAKALAGRVFKWAVAHGHCDSDPTASIGGDVLRKVEVENHPAITDPKAFGAFLRALAAYTGEGIVEPCFRFQLLTAVRPGEARCVTWGELDLDGATWRIGKDRTKMRREHVVPLSRQAVAILRDFEYLADGPDSYVFPGGRSGKPLSDNCFSAMLAGMGYQNRHSAHGNRSTFSSIAHEAGKDHDLIEISLAHAREKVTGIYNRSTRLDERRKLLQWWADRIDQLREVTK